MLTNLRLKKVAHLLTTYSSRRTKVTLRKMQLARWDQSMTLKKSESPKNNPLTNFNFKNNLPNQFAFTSYNLNNF